MTTIRQYDLRKATAVLAYAMGLTAVSGTLVEAQTLSNAEAECIPEFTSVQEGLEVVIEPGALEHVKAERLSQKFKGLAQQWRKERGSLSSINEMSMLNPYQNIIGMGPDALPLILGQLKAEGDDPDQWFWALLSISEANDLVPPHITAQEQGDFKAMADAWLKWGEEHGYAG